MSKNLTLKLNGAFFPDDNNPVVLTDYRYNATRMGNAPSISATVNYNRCLDDEWSDDVYVEFRGEKYYLRAQPNSSYDNTSIMYKHSVDLVSERVALEHTYFFDVVRDDTTQDKPASNSSNFSFSGSVTEFATRLTRSMKWSGLDYTVVVDDDVVLEDKFFDAQDLFIYNALQHMYSVYHIPYYFIGKVVHIGYADNIIRDVLKYGSDDALISIAKNTTSKTVINRITARGAERNIPYYYPNPTPKGFLKISSDSKTSSFRFSDAMDFCSNMDLDRDVVYYETDGYVTDLEYSSNGVRFYPYNHIPIEVNTPQEAWFKIYFDVYSKNAVVYIDCDFEAIGFSTQQVSVFYKTAELSDGEFTYHVPTKDGGLYCDVLEEGSYSLTVKVEFTHIGSSHYEVRPKPSFRIYRYWKYDDSPREFSLDKASIKIIGGEPSVGDTIRQEIDKRITVQNHLMPSIYRDTDGNEWFYNAENGRYKDADGNDILFDAPYNKTRPREYIYTNDEIYPSIENVKNAQNNYIDEIIDIAFDDNDNDEIYPVGHEKEGKYIHPYFFVKLRKFDGAHGFYLFDHAIESGAMTMSMKTGKCAACEFNIGVDEAYGKYNPVQVDGNGNVLRDEDGNVLCGRYPQGSVQIQEIQQDTRNAEVWIALKKDIQTFGMVMPNASSDYKPEVGDRFILLNIDLPEAYVLAAEKRLEQDAIKYMADNNGYQFSYTAKLSRIFFENSPDIASALTENSKVTLEYNNKQTELYVTSFSYNIREGQPLPEVDIELNNEIKVYKGAIDRVREDVKLSINNTHKIVATESGKTSDKISDLKFSTDKINSTTTETKDKVDAIEIELPGIKDSIDDTNNFIYDVASDRELYVSELIQINEDRIALDTEYANFVSTFERLFDVEVKGIVDANGDALYVRAANSMYEDFQDKLNKYEDELKAVVLSSGKPNITEAYTAAREAYTSAKISLVTAISNGTKAAIPDVDYLKQAFGEDSVLDTHAVVLGDLVAVKDEDGDVVAGIYGGANSTLNDNGYTDREHGALMMFAGAGNAQGAHNAKFRAYSDGTIYASDGVFSGLVRHKTVYVTKSNVDEYFPMHNGYRKISPMQMSSIISFWDSPVIGEEKFTSEDRLEIMLPMLHGGRVEDVGQVVNGNATYLRELVGVKFLVYNTTNAFISFCGRSYNPTTDALGDPVCYDDWVVGNESMAIAECKIGLRADKTEIIYWDVQVGSMGL